LIPEHSHGSAEFPVLFRGVFRNFLAKDGSQASGLMKFSRKMPFGAEKSKKAAFFLSPPLAPPETHRYTTPHVPA
jgi:hypothetical protein